MRLLRLEARERALVPFEFAFYEGGALPAVRPNVHGDLALLGGCEADGEAMLDN